MSIVGLIRSSFELSVWFCISAKWKVAGDKLCRAAVRHGVLHVSYSHSDKLFDNKERISHFALFAFASRYFDGQCSSQKLQVEINEVPVVSEQKPEHSRHHRILK
jgi:hypothetical protein